MFEAEYVDAGTIEHETLGLLVLLTILLSIVYYLLVVWSEVVVKIAPGLRCPDWMSPTATRRKTAAAKAEKGDEGEDAESHDSIAFNENPLRGMALATVNPLVDRESTGGLLSLEEQVKLQQLVETLKEEVVELKKKNAAVSTMNARGAKPEVTKKKKTGAFKNLGATTQGLAKKQGTHVDEFLEAEDGL
mmetsp:Transcript_16976/g.30758  ORF Transcript_16976/g.30758 Transcript_16976/m.30758 type:complete len:190 (+) Transcript_16976:478-1047(+)